MANEFIARKGLIALSDSKVTGSLALSGDLSVVGGDIVLGTTSIFSGGDTTSLNNIDAIDATTEATIEAAIDTLANLTSIQGQTVTLGGTVTLAGSLVTQNNNVTINAVGAARTLTLTESLTVGDGADVTITAVGSARTLTLNESLTVGDGNDGTITFSAASKTLTVENTSVVNQDLTTDASPQFTGIELSHASANTLTASSGVLSIEGNRIFHAGGTDIPVADGGTGVSTLTDGGVLLGSGTGAITAMSVLGDGEIIVGDASGDPIALDVGSSSAITVLGTVATGTWEATDVAVAHGGTGVSTLTDGGVLLGSGTGAITAMAVLANGEMIVGDGTTDPVAESGTTLRTSIGVGTGDSPQFTGVNVGAASDTTVTRASAGDIAVEGNIVYRAGGTDVAVADGGTGQSNLNNLITMGTHTTGNYVASLVAGTGVTLSNNSGETATPTVAIGQAVATTSTVTFNTGSFTGDLTITGNLIVQGATTQLETTQLTVEDALITVAKGSTNSTAANGAGIEIDMGGQTNPAMTWDHANQELDFNYPINSSQITGSFSGDGAGITNIVSTLNLVAEDSSTAAVALKTQTLTVTGGEGIDTVASGQTVTIKGEDASTTNKGIVELATNAETNTGTDAARVVTPAGLTAWTGDTALVTLGTIATGTWEGTTVAVAQGGTGVTSKTGTGNVVLSTSPTLVTPVLGTPASGTATNITGLPIVAGTTGTLTVARGGTGATSLNNLITMGTHTTGNYVATVTGGTGITSTGATSGESIVHSLSVDAAQTQITSVGALAAGSISSNFGTIDIGSSALTAGATTIDGALNESTTTTVATGGSSTTSVVATVATASYASAQFDYSVNDGTNYRAGTVVSVWKPLTGTIQFTDFSTPDIGNTSDATFTMDGSAANARLKFTSSAGTWTVKIATRAL